VSCGVTSAPSSFPHFPDLASDCILMPPFILRRLGPRFSPPASGKASFDAPCGLPPVLRFIETSFSPFRKASLYPYTATFSFDRGRYLKRRPLTRPLFFPPVRCQFSLLILCRISCFFLSDVKLSFGTTLAIAFSSVCLYFPLQDPVAHTTPGPGGLSLSPDAGDHLGF